MKHLNALLLMPHPATHQSVAATLSEAGIGLQLCLTQAELFRHLASRSYDAALLHLGRLGDMGYVLLSRLAAVSDIGIVAIGIDDQVETRMRCLQSGADVCVPAPVDFREVAAVLLALSRRLASRPPEAVAPARLVAARPVVPVGRWELRNEDWSLVAPSGAILSLSESQRLVLRSLLATPGRAVQRAVLLQQLARHANGARSIDVIINRLRKKAEHAGLNLPIRTVYGSGYMFVSDSDDVAPAPEFA